MVSPNFWLARGQEEGKNFNLAFKSFRLKLSRIVPRISLVGQAYIQFTSEPFLIFKENSQQAFFKYIFDKEPVPLNIIANEVKALEVLLKPSKIQDEFYYYWNDAVNTSEYLTKLLAMFSAIETLMKAPTKKKRFARLEKILGKRLKRKLWGDKNASWTALRHRLTHGEYFIFADFKDDYIDLVHKRIIRYFNKDVLKADLLNNNATNPQRHFWGNKYTWGGFIEATRVSDLNLKNVLQDFENNTIDNLQKYKIIDNENLSRKF